MPASRPRCRRCARRARRADIRGLLAISGIVGTFGIAFAQLLAGHEDGAAVPPWAAGYVTLVTSSYFMTKGAERHAAALRRTPRPGGTDQA